MVGLCSRKIIFCSLGLLRGILGRGCGGCADVCAAGAVVVIMNREVVWRWWLW